MPNRPTSDEYQILAAAYDAAHPEKYQEILRRCHESIARLTPGEPFINFGAVTITLVPNNYRTYFSRKLRETEPEIAPYLRPSRPGPRKKEPTAPPGGPLANWQVALQLHEGAGRVKMWLANQAEEAAANGDETWFNEQRAFIGKVADEFEAFANIIEDPEYRRRVAANEDPNSIPDEGKSTNAP